MDNMVNRVTDYSSKVKWIASLYEENDGGIVHGFQKEAIQNSSGARVSQTYFNWKCKIEFVQNLYGKFIIVEDFGTTGLTGQNYNNEELEKMVRSRELVNKPEERLARISCDNVSGGDAVSAGLFGVGKTVYIAISKVLTYYFESLSEKEGYRCNINKEDKMFSTALENEIGRKFIQDETGLAPIDHVGTRFIILDPTDKIIDSIIGPEKKMLKYVEETWWRVIRRLPSESGIFIQGIKAKVPNQYTFSEKANLFEKDTFYNEDSYAIEPGFRIKRIGFFIRKDLPDYLSGFYYYRRGMKIGQFSLKELQSHIPSNYIGFIEVDSEWEDELSKIENPTHYGVKGTSKNTNIYQYLQRAVKENVEDCLKDWGYLRDEQNANKVLHDLVDDIKEDVIETLEDNGFESLGKGDKHPSFEVRFKNIVYPHFDEAKYERSVYTDEVIRLAYTITNRTFRVNRYTARITIKSSDGTFKSILEEKQILVEPGTPSQEEVIIRINNESALQNSRNAIVLTVFLSNGGGKVVEKKLYFYYGIETDIQPGEDFKLSINRHDFPRIDDRRVNTGESVTNIQYSIENNLSKPVKMYVSVYTLNTDNNNEKIEDVSRVEYMVPPFGVEMFTSPIDIIFSRDVYLARIKKGIVEIKAALILGENLIEKQMGKSKRIDDYGFKVFFNTPVKSGLDFPFLLKESDRRSRSWIDDPNTIVINTSHPEFMQCKDLLEQSRYIAHQYLRQVIIIYAKSGFLDKDLLGADGTSSNHEYFLNLEEKIEYIWYKQCQK